MENKFSPDKGSLPAQTGEVVKRIGKKQVIFVKTGGRRRQLNLEIDHVLQEVDLPLRLSGHGRFHFIPNPLFDLEQTTFS